VIRGELTMSYILDWGINNYDVYSRNRLIEMVILEQARLTTEPILEQIQHRQGTEASSSTEAATNTRGHQYQQTDQHTHNPTENEA
jgi:hypothetical protein